MARTRTGGFPIGLRRLWFEWHKDLPGLVKWAAAENLGVIDLGKDGDRTAALALELGMRLGSVDLPEWQGMISPNRGARKRAVERNSAYIKACATCGPLNHFVVMLPEKPELLRSENFKYMVESFQQLAPVLEAHQAKIVIEGWPGPGALCCTPEGYEAFFEECSSPVFGVNYDPSHFLRMGIDPLRFLRDYSNRVYHVHGKDTELLDESLYRYGNEQQATFGKPHGFGGMHWRYTVPGHGVARWTEIFRILTTAGYQGAISIELEDENFVGAPEKERAGLLHSRNFLQGC
jgi:sugar phosphate isomerase/epimerase